MLEIVIVIGVGLVFGIATFCMGVDLNKNEHAACSTFNFLLKLHAHLGI